MRSSVLRVPSAARARALWLGLLLLAALASWPALLRAQTLPDFTELVERVGPAVVNIRTLERGRQAAAGGVEVDPNVEEFFRRFGIPLPGRPDPAAGRAAVTRNRSSVASAPVSSSAPMAM